MKQTPDDPETPPTPVVLSLDEIEAAITDYVLREYGRNAVDLQFRGKIRADGSTDGLQVIIRTSRSPR